MMKLMILFGFLTISIVFTCCKSNSDELIEVHNVLPKYANAEYVRLEKLYNIDVTQISLFNKDSNNDMQRLIDFDEDNNMYILDGYESKISVFDKQGGLIRTFGKAGQGPKEFLRPNRIVVNKNKVYVFQGFQEYKIVDLEGAYISSHLINVENRLKTRIINDSFYFFRGKVDQTFTKLEFILSRYNIDFSSGKEVFRHNYSPGMQGANYDYTWPNWLFISDSGEFYFPDDNLSKYSITKFSRDGVPKLSFSRKYNSKKYSQGAKDRFYSIYEKQIKSGSIEFPQSPPIVRLIFEDNKKNIWVISGETYEDNRNPEFENTIDIFNKKGEWLYSFKSKFLSRFCLYNNGKIYRVLPINLDSYDQYIEVYNIVY